MLFCIAQIPPMITSFTATTTGDNELFFDRIGIWFSVAQVFHFASPFFYVFQRWWATLAVQLFMLVTVVLIYLRVGVHYGHTGQTQRVREEVAEGLCEEDSAGILQSMDKESKDRLMQRPISSVEFWFVQLPLSALMAWLTVTAIVTFFSAWKTQFLPISAVSTFFWTEQGWAIVVMVSIVFGVTVIGLARCDAFFTATVAWFLIGIGVNRVRDTHLGVSICAFVLGGYSLVLAIGIGCYCLAVLIYRRRRKEFRNNNNLDEVLNL